MHKQRYNYVELVNKGIAQRLPCHAILKMYSPHAYSGNLSQRDLEHFHKNNWTELSLVKKFFKRFPEVKQMPITGPLVK